MVKKRFYYIEDVCIILGKSQSSIHGHLARKHYDAVPPPIKLGRRLAWPVESFDEWINEKANRANEKARAQRNRAKLPVKRRGRPRKEEWKNGDGQ